MDLSATAPLNAVTVMQNSLPNTPTIPLQNALSLPKSSWKITSATVHGLYVFPQQLSLQMMQVPGCRRMQCILNRGASAYAQFAHPICQALVFIIQMSIIQICRWIRINVQDACMLSVHESAVAA